MMKSEKELRDWRMSLRREYAAHNDIPSMATGIIASIDTLSWALGDSPETDLARVLSALSDVYDDEGCGIWVRNPQRLLDGFTPLQMIAWGKADEVLVIIEALAGGPRKASA